MTTAPQNKDLAARIDRLERRNRWTGAIAALSIMLLLATWLLAAATPGQNEVRASRFLLVDENGKGRAAFWLKDGVPALDLCDENGAVRGSFAVSKEGPHLYLFDQTGKHRGDFSVSKDGPLLALYDETGKSRVQFTVSKDGPGLAMYDENAKPLFFAP